jgi:hypothetical protein
MSVDRSRPKVVFVGGYGRSGSTLLDRALGTVDGCFSAGSRVCSRAAGVAAGRRSETAPCGRRSWSAPLELPGPTSQRHLP